MKVRIGTHGANCQSLLFGGRTLSEQDLSCHTHLTTNWKFAWLCRLSTSLDSCKAQLHSTWVNPQGWRRKRHCSETPQDPLLKGEKHSAFQSNPVPKQDPIARSPYDSMRVPQNALFPNYTLAEAARP